jgi:hypothetical protein
MVLASGRAKRWTLALRRLWSGYMRFSVLFCGLPVSAGQKHVRLAPEADPRQVVSTLDAVLCQLARRERAWLTVVKEFDDTDQSLFAAMADRGYLRADSLPMNHMEPRFQSLEQYCEALRSHYRYKIKKSLRKFDKAGLRVEALSDPEQIVGVYTDQLHRLYQAVVDKAEHKLEMLPAEFFRELARRLPGHVWLIVIRQGERVVAFNWGLMHGGVFRSLFIGIDYDLNPTADLYFNTMLRGIVFASQLGATDIAVGQTADDFKSRLGCYQRPRFLFLKSRSRLFQMLIRAMATRVFPPPQPQPPRDLFKPNEDDEAEESTL